MGGLALFPVFLPSEVENRRVTDDQPKALLTGRFRGSGAGQESLSCQFAKVGVAGWNPVVRSKYIRRSRYVSGCSLGLGPAPFRGNPVILPSQPRER
jgi:hypothetical protein